MHETTRRAKKNFLKKRTNNDSTNDGSFTANMWLIFSQVAHVFYNAHHGIKDSIL
jgi:hypothetical protein